MDPDLGPGPGLGRVRGRILGPGRARAGSGTGPGGLRSALEPGPGVRTGSGAEIWSSGRVQVTSGSELEPGPGRDDLAQADKTVEFGRFWSVFDQKGPFWPKSGFEMRFFKSHGLGKPGQRDAFPVSLCSWFRHL